MFSGFGPSHSTQGQHLPANQQRKSEWAPQLGDPGKPSVDLLALQNATRLLHECFSKDTSLVPEYADLLTSSSSQVSATYSIYPDDLRVPFQKRKFIGIPEGLFQYYETTNVISHMGLLPEIERAWVSIDHKLFLWDYVDGHEISSFVDQPDVITDVTLVKPKKGLFIEDITNLLVICTPISLILLGVSFSPSVGGRQHEQIKLYATDLSLSTEVEMVSVTGTDDGRIFMCGAQDGSLYEFHYQESDSWFGKRTQLVNHTVGGLQSLLPRFATSGNEDRILFLKFDAWRQYIYALTSTGTILIYKPNGEKSVQLVQTIPNIYKLVNDRAPGHPALNVKDLQITGLHVIEESSSKSGAQFFALTSTGVRIYFGIPNPSAGYVYSSATSSYGGRTIQLCHIRLPPSNLFHPDVQATSRNTITPYLSSQGQHQNALRTHPITKLESSCYAKGLTVSAQQGAADGTDFVLCMSTDIARTPSVQAAARQQGSSTSQIPYHPNAVGEARPPLTEHAAFLAIPGRTWAIASLPRSQNTAGEDARVSQINELAAQFNEPPPQFMLLTNVGLTILSKRRVLDVLRAALEELQSDMNSQYFEELRQGFGRDQLCCMLLGLACGNIFLDNTGGASTSLLSPDLAVASKQAFYDIGERPMWSERTTYGPTEQKGTVTYSGRREGLALYTSRLMRPFWRSNVTMPGILNRQKLAIPEHLLVGYQKNLSALKDFIENNPQLFVCLTNDSAPSSRVPVADQEAWKAEQASVQEVMGLVSRTIEGLSFVLLLNDHMLGDLIAKCDPETQSLIASQTFEKLITTQDGMNVSRALVNVIIDQQIGQQISIDTVSEVLQNRCGTFCSTDDVMLYKAKENIRKAAETHNPNERQNSLAESLRLFIKGARVLEFEKLQEVCGDYQQLDYPKGAIELPLRCASLVDPDNLGVEAWNSGMLQNDPRTAVAQRRLQCYDLVMDSLRVYEEKCTTTAGNATNDAEVVRSHAYELAFLSEDEIFHCALYTWLILRGLADDLLEMRPPYLEAYLKREPLTVQKYQLLWQFYVKSGQPLRAAEVLSVLAESTEFDLELDQRVECLTLAVANAKSHPISSAGQHETAIAFLTHLEEKLDVAQVQLEIYHYLAPHVDDAVEVGKKIRLLSKKLFTMSDLYQDYAVAFDLPEMKLLCLHVSEHRDENVVRPIWNQIIDEILQEEKDIATTADLIGSRVAKLGKRFYPSEYAFPLRFVATLLVRFSLTHKGSTPQGWAARVLVQCGVAFAEVWDVLHEMYESQIPPFNDQANVQAISSDIAILLSDWVEAAKRPQSAVAREFPVGRMDQAVEQYLSELEPSRTDTKAIYEGVKRSLRRYW